MASVKRIDITESQFEVFVDGEFKFAAERQKDGRWRLFRAGKPEPIDESQWSNDLLDRVRVGHYDRKE